jgi:uncharacterized membrane protein
MSSIITWLVRYGHVLGGGIWLGGYALLALAILPRLEKDANKEWIAAAIVAVRVLTYAGTVTMLFGLLLITRTRGYATILRGGEWSGIIITCFVIAVILQGVGDSMLRPALKQFAATGNLRRARRAAWIGFALTILAIGLMTRALYATS